MTISKEEHIIFGNLLKKVKLEMLNDLAKYKTKTQYKTSIEKRVIHKIDEMNNLMDTIVGRDFTWEKDSTKWYYGEKI